MVKKIIQHKYFSRLFHVGLLLIWLFIWREHPSYISYTGELYTKRTLLVATGIVALTLQIIINKKWSFKFFYWGLMAILVFSFIELALFIFEDGLQILKSKYLKSRLLDLLKVIILQSLFFFIYRILKKKTVQQTNNI
jgi:hypothetical protein